MVDSDITTLEETIREAAESARRFRPLLRSLTWTTITCAVLMLVVSTALCMIANEEYVHQLRHPLSDNFASIGAVWLTGLIATICVPIRVQVGLVLWHRQSAGGRRSDLFASEQTWAQDSLSSTSIGPLLEVALLGDNQRCLQPSLALLDRLLQSVHVEDEGILTAKQTAVHVMQGQEKTVDGDGTHAAEPVIVPAGNPLAMDVDVSTVPSIRPIATTDLQGLPNLKRQYSMEFPTQVIAVTLGKNPNPGYQKACPFPEIYMEDVDPSQFWWRGDGNVGYLRYVEAFRRHWTWPPRDPKILPKTETQILWHWDVPNPKLHTMRSWSPADARSRYCAICLYNHFDYAKRDSLPTDPELFFFDRLNGVRWQTTIPVDLTVEEISTTSTPAISSDYLTDVQVGVASGGNRVLALVSRPDKRVSVLFVFDGSGKLLRTLRFPHYMADGNHLHGWDLRHSPSGQNFLLCLWEPRTYARKVALLVDLDGNVLGRFESEEGKWLESVGLTDRYAEGGQSQTGKPTVCYIYRLPTHSGGDAEDH